MDAHLDGERGERHVIYKLTSAPFSDNSQASLSSQEPAINTSHTLRIMKKHMLGWWGQSLTELA